MRIKDYISPVTLIITLFSLIVLMLNIFFNIHPIVKYFNFLEKNRVYWAIPLTLLIPIWLFVFDRIRYQKILEEKLRLFNTTIHTVQDIINNTMAKTQLIILDMEENDVDSRIIHRTKETMSEITGFLATLSSLDPLNSNIKKVNERLHVFEIDK